MLFRRLTFGCAALLVASPAVAEVADKVPSLGWRWGWALGLCATTLLLELWRKRRGLLVVPVGALLARGGHEELSDPYVGPAIFP